MGHIAKTLHASRSFYHTGVSRSLAYLPNNFRAIFQRFFQSGEEPIIFAMKRKPSDVVMCRGAYGLSLAGIFVSFYGVYHMIQDTYTKKQRET